VPLVGALHLLSRASEDAWLAGHPGLANLLAAARIALYWAWFLAVWKCARNVANPLWTPAARGALIAGLVLVVLT
jgi:uncharacterized BrkB/YihY/UPF0761 family membrane protein